MHISYGMLYENVSDNNGFGYAGRKMIQSLKSLGHKVSYLNPNAPVEIWFAQPDRVKWSGTRYRIMYVPWESTEFPEGWVDAMNEADEVWTPSPVIAEWMSDAGVKPPIKVYQHGVDPVWSTRIRYTDDTFKILHHGAEALRKGFTETTQIFRTGFYDTDSEMIFKCQIDGWNVKLPNVRWVAGRMPLDDLISLYHECHMMIYPSWGEGFGLTPLQAMSTGMPVLITKGWAPYEYLLPPECLIDSELVDSPWPDVHPGKMFKPNVDDAIDKAVSIHENYGYQERIAREIVADVRLEYSWDDLTEDAFSHLLSLQK